MNIQETVKALRAIAIELNEDRISHARLVRLSDRRFDLEARLQMLYRINNIEPV